MIETGWLIEQRLFSRPQWWTVTAWEGPTWTTDANQAIRFARREDALRTSLLVAGFHSVTEHQWG